MKNILTGAIILIFISLQANGQQSQDTLYLKNGYKAGGKLLRKSKTEYLFQTAEGVILTFSPPEVEKVVPTIEHELNQQYHKAVKMRNAGIILTLSGAGILVTSIILEYLPGDPDPDPDQTGDPSHDGISIIAIKFAELAGAAITITGIPLWAVGGSRKAKAELSLQKFNIKPENSMALGLGITIRF